MPPPFLKHEQGHIYNISSSKTDGLANWLTDRLTRLASSQLKISHKTIWLAGNTPLMIPHSILDGRKEETNQLVHPTSRLIEVSTNLPTTQTSESTESDGRPDQKLLCSSSTNWLTDRQKGSKPSHWVKHGAKKGHHCYCSVHSSPFSCHPCLVHS